MARKKVVDTEEEERKTPRFKFSLRVDKYGNVVGNPEGLPKKGKRAYAQLLKPVQPETPAFTLVPGSFDSTPPRRTGLTKVYVKRPVKEAKMKDNAAEHANMIVEKHGVKVVLIKTDKEFYSDLLIKESVENNKYYVSEESPETTAQATDWLIRYQAEKDRHLAQEAQERKLELLNIANEKRTEKSVQTAQSVAPRIAEITQRFRDEHKGKEPSLHKLADLLNDANVPAPGGPQSKWYAQTVKRVVNAEKSVHQK